MKCFPKLPPFSISASSNFPRFSSIGAIIFSSANPNASCSTYITALANFHNSKYFSSLCTTSNAVEAEESVVEAELTEVIEEPEAEEQETEPVSPLTPRRSHPAQFGETFDGPPSLERSGSEHQEGAVTSPLPEEEGLGEKVEPSLERGTG